MADFTILVLGFDRQNLCCVLEPVYVPQALNQAEAGWLAAEGYEAETGIPVQPLYIAAGRVVLEKLTLKDEVVLRTSDKSRPLC